MPDKAHAPSLDKLDTQTAQAFIDHAWKTLPSILALPGDENPIATAEGVYRGMTRVALSQPALHSSFAADALNFIRVNPTWTKRVLPDLFVLAREEPRIVTSLIEHGWKIISDLEGFTNGSMSAENLQYAQKLCRSTLEAAQQAGAMSHFLARSLENLTEIAGHSMEATSALYEIILAATKDNKEQHERVLRSAGYALLESHNDNANFGLRLLSVVTDNLEQRPEQLSSMMGGISHAMKRFAGVYPASVYPEMITTRLIDIAGEDKGLLRRVIEMGQDVAGIQARMKSKQAVSFLETLHEKGKHEAALLPSLIRSAWQSAVPFEGPGSHSAMLDEMAAAARRNPEARTAHLQGAAGMRAQLVKKDDGQVSPALSLMRDALGLKRKKYVLGDFFALTTHGDGNNKRETWFIATGSGHVLVKSGASVFDLNSMPQNLPHREELAAVGEIVSGVFYEGVSPQEGRRSIQRATGLAFDTLG